MILAVNIGNSNIRLGFFSADKCGISWVISSKPYRSKYEYINIIAGLYNEYSLDTKLISGVVIGSVVPELNQPIKDALIHLHPKTKNIYFVDRNSPSPVSHNSKQIGTDLYANAVAAQHFFPNKQVLVIDFGTALTFTHTTAEAVLEGVVIAPGVKTALQALIGNTAQLHMIALEKPKKVLGKNTESCIQSGMIHGFSSLVEGLIHKIEEEQKSNIEVVVTGGLCHLFEGLSNKIKKTDKYHTINGLYLLYKYQNTTKN